MAFDFAAVKGIARRRIHDLLSIDVEFINRRLAVPVTLRIRYHSKQDIIGDLRNEGYPMSIDGVERIIFDIEELLLKGVVIERGDRITIAAKNYPSITLAIETQEKSEGPLEQIWRVVKV